MKYNPYKSLDSQAFWKNGVEKCDITFPENIYDPKWKIGDTDKIATMGSCFAQHIAKWLRDNGFNAPFYETDGFKESEQMFSANYGNVYTVRQALQLIQESAGKRRPSEIVWSTVDGKFIDAIRPNSIKGGFNTAKAVLDARVMHLKSIQKMVKDFDVLIFTLGLTEAWEIRKCGTIIPTAPGVLGGDFDSGRYRFLNFKYNEIMADLHALYNLLKELRNDKPFKMLLTVSPVPLTATATNKHALVATTYSKAVLRSVAGDFASEHSFVEYFPSFEIINNPAARSSFFESNLRSVKKSSVGNVMNVFSSSALVNPRKKPTVSNPTVSNPTVSNPTVSNPTVSNEEVFDPDCEDALLEEFSKDNVVVEKNESIDFVCIGTSHLASLRSAMSDEVNPDNEKSFYFFPTNWGKCFWSEFNKNNYLTHFWTKDDYSHLIENISIKKHNNLVLIGLGLAGDEIVRCHGPMGRDTTPKMPIKKVVDKQLINFYKPVIASKIDLAKSLDMHSRYEKIFWIMAPDMCVDVAKLRLGEEFVNSGSYIIHKKAYFAALGECLPNLKKTEFVFHNYHRLCDPNNGFTLNTYLASDNPFDIHCSPLYYKSSVSHIFDSDNSLKL